VRRTTEIQVGVTVIAAVVVLVWGVTWLREFKVGKKTNLWIVSFPQTGGLGPSDEVQVNGIRKGTVASIEKVIAVDLRATGEKWTDRDTIPGVFEPGIGEFVAQAGPTFDSMNRVIESLDRLATRLDRDGEVDKTLANLRQTSEELLKAMKENRALLNETMRNARDATKTVRNVTTGREEQLRQTLDGLERGARNFERLTARMDSVMVSTKQVADKMNNGNGTAAMLLNDRKLYDESRATLQSLKELIEDIKKNPKKYVDVSIF
jgi:phospholipid/cholesterol/gamma-HCH transport system substrate-binding protein